MSKKVVSIMAIWLIMSMLVQAAVRPLPRNPATPAVQALHVELLGHWPATNVVDLEVYGDRTCVNGNPGSSPVSGSVHALDVSSPANPPEVAPEQRNEAG